MFYMSVPSLGPENAAYAAFGKSTKLTPRLVTLLHLLMDKHGEVVEREPLFKKVWETNYTGDTRTLDDAYLLAAPRH